MKKLTLILAAVALAFGGFTATASASAFTAPDGNDLQIVRVGTDAMGADSYRNRNREFVTFKNVSGEPLDIAGVVIEDDWGHARTDNTCNRYEITKLPGNDTTVIAPGATVTVYNGSRWGGDRRYGDAYHLYANSDTDCGTFGHFYNNGADTVWITHGSTELAKWGWNWHGGYSFTPGA
jgi:hypothetical protein